MTSANGDMPGVQNAYQFPKMEEEKKAKQLSGCIISGVDTTVCYGVKGGGSLVSDKILKSSHVVHVYNTNA